MVLIAATSLETAQADEDLGELEILQILGDRYEPIGTDAVGQYELNRRDIEEYGSATGDFTSLLEQVPNVQFSEDRRDPDDLFDLRPDSVSISGGRFYENNFRVDGLSNNSRLDPAGSNPNQLDDVPGHEQSLFIDSSLIKSIDVYDSNVPAEFGRFTGGVVDVETRRAGSEPETRIQHSQTSDAWVDYRVFVPEPDDDAVPQEPPEPKDFSRQRSTISHERPLGEDSSMVLSAARSRSTTPELTLGESRPQRQRNLNVMGKFSTVWSDDTLIDVQARHAPYRNELFITNAKDSDFTITGGGTSSRLSVDHETPSGTDVDARLSVSHSENSRQAPTDFFNWARTRSRDWGNLGGTSTSNQGGFGNLDKEQTGLRTSLNVEPNPVSALRKDWALQYGAQADFSRLNFVRPETLFVYQDARVNPDIECRGREVDCVDGEQYFRQRTRYPADDVTVSLQEYALYSEATTDFDRLRLTLGLRYDYNDFLKNHDVAWRTRGRYDLFGTDQTVLTAGFNRYYSGALMTYKLREAREPFVREFRGATQNVVNDWESDTGQGSVRFESRELDTPFSDEVALGLRQRLFGGVASLQYTRRDNQDELSQETGETQQDGTQPRFLTNKGESQYESIALSWRRQWERASLGLSTTWSESESSNATFDDSVEEAGQNEFVLFRGERVREARLDVLREDFNRPFVLNLSAAYRFSPSLNMSLSSRYRGAFTNIVDSGDRETVITEQGEEQLPVFVEETRPSTFISDLRMDFSQDISEHFNLQIELEVSNVFNSRTHTVGEKQGGIEIGRRYWLGGTLTF